MRRVGRPDAHGCHQCRKGQLQEKKKQDYRLLMFEVREGAPGY